ncbi:type I restriction enzyme M protein [Arcicella aurantiaca]|uniref:site-specific DNA-methyltransferase (adenine-specific) n=1 Tax=Arcicella aurantiaca TaxID=591202 RepID=A0A316DC77_9BACT|nr:N-6 DNA methylase [Arcicella aurantiaca]PWK15747.1 type I restriction enzyme M protein [Arcicella aurantiaca]
MTTLIERGLESGLIEINEKNILYKVQNFSRDWANPEEKVRAEAYLMLIFNYGYSATNIDFEVKAKQGSSGKTSADIVVFLENSNKKRGFLVIEVKSGDSKNKQEDVRKQARSYAKSEEINCQLYAYKIGDAPFVAFKTNGKDVETTIPYRYTLQCVYVYLLEGKGIPEEQAHFEPLKPSTPYDLKRIFGQCHDEIWQSGEKGKEEALEEFNKLLFLKMYDEIEREKAEKHLQEYGFQTRALETKSQLRNRIIAQYNEAIEKRKVDDLLRPINLDEYQIFFIVEKLQSISLIATDKDPKGLAFETYTENHMKGEFGQYFTPRNIVDFMVKVSPIEWREDFNSASTVLDPSCGSGSFLTQVVSTFKNRFRNPKNWQEFANNSVYGIEISEKISVSAKINFALHDDGHDNVQRANGLNLYKLRWKVKQFDLILTNPPFGGEPIKNLSNEQDKALENLSRFYDYTDYTITQKQIDEIEIIRGKVKDIIKYTDQIRPEQIFIELFYKALKEGGIVEVILPDGILTNSTAQYIRDFIELHFQILAIISLPQYTFSHYGAGVKTSILILKKLSVKTTLRIKEQQKKYLISAVKSYEYQLQILEERKAKIENEHIEVIKIRQWQKYQIEILEKSELFNDKTYIKKELYQLQKEALRKIKVITNTPDYKEWKKGIDQMLNEEIKVIQELIYEKASNDYKRFETDQQYEIFMAIAEHIGYDATGKPTQLNELNSIAEELIRFLKVQHENPNSFFA